MSWYLVPYHIVAHIQPTVNGGTITPGWPVGNICAFSPTKGTKWTAASLDLIWDRTGADHKSFNAIIVSHHNLSTGTHRVYADSASTPTTALYSAQTFASNAPVLYPWSTPNSSRYVRVVLSPTSGECGFVSLCRAYDVGRPMRGASYGSGGPGAQSLSPSGDMDESGMVLGSGSVSATFLNVARATGLLIRDDFSQAHAEQATGYAQYALGGAGGAAPIALWDDDSGRLWYGYGSVTVNETTPGKTSISVQILDWPYGAFL